MCGTNESSQLGWDPSKPPSHVSLRMEDGSPLLTTPSRIASLDAFRVHHLSVGLSHVVSVVGVGMLASWGANELGQLGEKHCQ